MLRTSSADQCKLSVQVFMHPGGLSVLQSVLHVQFARNRYLSGKLNVFYDYQTMTSTYPVVICVRLQ